MNDDCIFPLPDAEALVQGFTGCTLPKSEWTHEAHLMAGLYMQVHFGEKAIDEMRLRIRRYNEATGSVNDDQNGYHETLTVFWLWAIRRFCSDENGDLHWNQQSLDHLLTCEELADRNLWKAHYSVEVVKSVAARRAFVPPDGAGLEG